MSNIKVKVERAAYERNDKSYFAYFIRGNIRGRDIRVLIVPPDNGGYRVLDIVFDEDMEADFVVRPFEIKDEATGKIIRGNSYAVQSTDEDGKVYECAVKPYRKSDKALLDMLLG